MRKEGINFIERHEIYENGITLIALVITIVLNCSFLAMA